jgi:hypothetical protein
VSFSAAVDRAIADDAGGVGLNCNTGIIVAEDHASIPDSVNGTQDQLRNVEPPSWTNPMPSGNQRFCRALEAITGKPSADDLKQFFSGVIKIERHGTGIRVYRQDDQTMDIEPGTEFGDRLLAGIDRASQRAAKKFGRPVGDLIAGLSSVTLVDNKISVQRTGASVIPIVVRKQKQEKRYWIKELRLDQMTFEICDRKGTPTIEHVEGLAAVLDAMSIPVELREFAQTVNRHGQKVYLIGIKNPLPRPITNLLGLGDVLHLHFSEHVEGNDKKVETEENEWEDAERAAGTTVTTNSGTTGKNAVAPGAAAVTGSPMEAAVATPGAVAPTSAAVATPGAVAPTSAAVATPGAVAPTSAAVATPGAVAPTSAAVATPGAVAPTSAAVAPAPSGTTTDSTAP